MKDLTEQVPGYALRTIYRYTGKLVELDVIERDEEPGVPSKVVYCLTDPCGTDLFDLLDSYATASMTRLPDGRVHAHDWASLGLLADLWESGMVDKLSCEPRTPTQLARARGELTYHQVNRRANLFRAGGLLREAPAGRRRRYELTEKARRAMALVAGVGCWRHDHVVSAGEDGLTASEVATVLRAVLPLMHMPDRAGKTVRFNVLDKGELNGGEGEVVWAAIASDGSVDNCAKPASPDGWARAWANDWLKAVLDEKRGEIQTGGDHELIDSCLSALHELLWTPAPQLAHLLQLD
jgi:DNA-binding HxlR family transcriptional regulator